ncbi:hypothetical protein [Rhizobacter sp. Root16D2]|uniref:hypothetical protein n=2 Tax=Rhizobacter TaxID=212743 RepID=UPI0006FA1446|nr:hypothetical protein [Rhizobacter sp. Root16D2]KQU66146.1 hypothetical protein ASC88_11325 [Rhizobacter sp. Root29]KQV97716.1 hypothetical protein ASC98_10320 [Rhizobacter sp. Root1238]KRB18900.1 hypothetical protein ASE08_06735 [Rhizobacter sp. Root16D2]
MELNAMHTATVITEAGRVVGVQVDLPAGSRRVGPVAMLRAGPAQTLHRVELELPASLATTDEIERFHAGIAKQLAMPAADKRSAKPPKTRK